MGEDASGLEAEHRWLDDQRTLLWMKTNKFLLDYIARRAEFRDEFYGAVLVYATANFWKYKPTERGYTVSELEKAASDLGVKSWFKRSRTPYHAYGRLQDMGFVECSAEREKNRASVQRFKIKDREEMTSWLLRRTREIMGYKVLVEGLWSLPDVSDYLSFFGYTWENGEDKNAFREWLDVSECPKCHKSHFKDFYLGIRDLGKQSVEAFQSETGRRLNRIGEWR